jgi:hypothetical protein
LGGVAGVFAGNAIGSNNAASTGIRCENATATEVPRVAEGDNRLDDRANNIIAIASRAGLNEAQKAVQIVQSIICVYFPNHASSVEGIEFRESVENGLEVSPAGTRSGAGATGRIYVSRQFLQGTTSQFFARRVLQVRHELQHIEQYQSGMTGQGNRRQREFLAHATVALSNEVEGTGRMSRTTRRDVIDEALRHYYCMPDADQVRHRTLRDDLLRRRETLVRSGRLSTQTELPSSCPTE